MISATGLGSGLDINAMVTQLVAAERAGSDTQLTRGKAEISAQLSAFGSLKSAVASFQTSLGGLSALSSFDRRRATTTDAAVIGLAVQDSATPAAYSIEVTQLAASHALASMSFADKSAALGTGTLDIRFGTLDYDAEEDAWNGFSVNADRAAASIVIDESNNTLQGVMQAINDADIGVAASIVNDGSGYRLLLSAADTGAANAIEISVADADGEHADASGLSRLAFNADATHFTQTRAARDALLTINGLPVSSASNSVTSAIEGLTLNLKQVTTKPVDVIVEKDSSSVTAAVNAFIAGYNRFVTTVNELTKYNAETRVAGQLLGDFSVRALQSQVDRLLRNPVDGLGGGFTLLFELGIKSGANGQLSLDTARFNEVLASDPAAVRAIFTAVGAPTDSGISYKGASAATLTGEYAVELTALGSAGSYEGDSVLPDFGTGGTVTIDAGNDGFTLNVDGVESGEISLTHGVYESGDALAAELQTRINGDATLRDAGVSVTVSYDADAGVLRVASESIGSTSRVDVLTADSNLAATLGLSVASGTPGTDVAGSIGGVAASGAGNLLTGAEGSGAEGLRLSIDGGATGARGSVNFTRGIADRLNAYLTEILEADEGMLETRISTLKDRSQALEDRKAQLELRWEAVEARYRRQFNALDALLANLQATSTYLEGQLANLPKINNRNR